MKLSTLPVTTASLADGFGNSISPVSTLKTRVVNFMVPLPSVMKPPVTMWCTPSSLPIFTAVAGSVKFSFASFCSSRIFWIWSRSMTLMAGLPASSPISRSAMPFESGSSSSCALPMALLLK